MERRFIWAVILLSVFSSCLAIRVQSISQATEALLQRYSRQATTDAPPDGSGGRGDGVFGNNTIYIKTRCAWIEATNVYIQVKNSDAVGYDVDSDISSADITADDEGTCATGNENGTVTMVVEFKNIQNSTVKDAKVRFDFVQDSFNWWISNMSLSANFKANGTKDEGFDGDLFPQDIGAGRGNAYLCGDQYAFTSGYNESGLQGGILFESLIIQPFLNGSGDNATWGEIEPCEYAFTLPLWMAIVTGLIMALILALGISMLVNIKTPDRFDDPKTSKLLSVPSE